MKKLIALLLFIAFITPLSSQEKVDEGNTTTFYFIRHAEKDISDKSNKDPHLIEKGVLRALKWSYVFEHIKFDVIYSTNYNRTRETAQPTAEKKELEITLYDPSKIDGNAFYERNKGKTALIVGHSNSTPTFVNKMIGKEKYAQIDEKNNANLYIVTISPNGEISDMILVIE